MYTEKYVILFRYNPKCGHIENILNLYTRNQYVYTQVLKKNIKQQE